MASYQFALNPLSTLLLFLFFLSNLTFSTAIPPPASCPETPHFILPIQPCQDSHNKGVWVELGTTHLQKVCLLPSTVISSIAVMGKEICDAPERNASVESQRGCEVRRGRLYDSKKSGTWREVGMEGVEGRRAEEFYRDLGHDWKSGKEELGFDITEEEGEGDGGDSGVLKFSNASIMVVTEGKHSTMGSFGVGPGSYLLELAGAEEFGLYAGSQFSEPGKHQGSLVLGGYDRNMEKGRSYEFPIEQSGLRADGRICPFSVKITRLTLSYTSEGAVEEIPLLGSGGTQEACIEPLDVLFRFPKDILRKFMEATNHDMEPRNKTVPQDGWQYPEPGVVYPANESSRLASAELTFELDERLVIRIPNRELRRELLGMNEENARMETVGEGSLWETAVFASDAGLNPKDWFTLGMVFLSQAYLRGHFPSKSKSSFYLAQAAEGNSLPHTVSSRKCNVPPPAVQEEKYKGDGPSNGVIAGAVVGGMIGGLIIAGGMYWLVIEPHRRIRSESGERSDAEESGATYAGQHGIVGMSGRGRGRDRTTDRRDGSSRTNSRSITSVSDLGRLDEGVQVVHVEKTAGRQ